MANAFHVVFFFFICDLDGVDFLEFGLQFGLVSEQNLVLQYIMSSRRFEGAPDLDYSVRNAIRFDQGERHPCVHLRRTCFVNHHKAILCPRKCSIRNLSFFRHRGLVSPLE